MKAEYVKVLAISASFDGEQIRLIEPRLGPKEARLLATVLATSSD
jgi:hypothetical protein